MIDFRAPSNLLRFAVLAALVSSLGATAAHADVYKWVDAQGHTHYSDTPPEAGVSAGTVSMDHAADAPAAAAAGNAAKVPDAAAAQKTAAMRGKMLGVEQPDNSPEAQQARDEACQRMKTELNLLTGGGRVFTLDAKGERSYIDDDTRNARQAELQQQIGSGCK